VEGPDEGINLAMAEGAATTATPRRPADRLTANEVFNEVPLGTNHLLQPTVDARKRTEPDEKHNSDTEEYKLPDDRLERETRDLEIANRTRQERSNEMENQMREMQLEADQIRLKIHDRIATEDGKRQRELQRRQLKEQQEREVAWQKAQQAAQAEDQRLDENMRQQQNQMQELAQYLNATSQQQNSPQVHPSNEVLDSTTGGNHMIDRDRNVTLRSKPRRENNLHKQRSAIFQMGTATQEETLDTGDKRNDHQQYLDNNRRDIRTMSMLSGRNDRAKERDCSQNSRSNERWNEEDDYDDRYNNDRENRSHNRSRNRESSGRRSNRDHSKDSESDDENTHGQNAKRHREEESGLMAGLGKMFSTLGNRPKAPEHKTGEDAYLFIRAFNAWVEMNSVTDKMAALAFKQSLKDQLQRMWIEEIRPEIQQSYVKVSHEFLEAFDSSKPQFHTMAMSELPKQMENENVQKYYERYFKLYHRMQDKEALMLNFVKNLRAEYKTKVISAQENGHVKNLHDAFKIARKWEQVDRDTAGGNNQQPTAYADVSLLENGEEQLNTTPPKWAIELKERQNSMESRIDNNKNSVTTLQGEMLVRGGETPGWARELIALVGGGSSERSGNKCYECGSNNHYVRNCPHTARGQGSKNDFQNEGSGVGGYSNYYMNMSREGRDRGGKQWGDRTGIQCWICSGNHYHYECPQHVNFHPLQSQHNLTNQQNHNQQAQPANTQPNRGNEIPSMTQNSGNRVRFNDKTVGCDVRLITDYIDGTGGNVSAVLTQNSGNETVKDTVSAIQMAPSDEQKVFKLTRYLGSNKALAVEIKLQRLHTTDTVQKQTLCDTGATVSVIGEKFWREVLMGTKEDLRKYEKTKLTSACGTLLDVMGVVNIKMEVDGAELSHDFVVLTKVTTDLIIGVDFLERYGGVLNLPNQTMTINLPKRKIGVLGEENERSVWETMDLSNGQVKPQLAHPTEQVGYLLGGGGDESTEDEEQMTTEVVDYPSSEIALADEMEQNQGTPPEIALVGSQEMPREIAPVKCEEAPLEVAPVKSQVKDMIIVGVLKELSPKMSTMWWMWVWLLSIAHIGTVLEVMLKAATSMSAEMTKVITHTTVGFKTIANSTVLLEGEDKSKRLVLEGRRRRIQSV